jgi:hypothetical protein
MMIRVPGYTLSFGRVDESLAVVISPRHVLITRAADVMYQTLKRRIKQVLQVCVACPACPTLTPAVHSPIRSYRYRVTMFPLPHTRMY